MTTLARTTATVAAACCLAACSGEGDGEDGPAPAPTAASASASTSVSTDAELTLTGGPLPDLTVRPGARVLVRNADSVAHNVVAEDGSFRTSDLPPGEEATFVAPSRPGDYPYICTLQPGVRGTLSVRDASTPTTTSAPSASRTPQPSATRSPGRTTRPSPVDPGGY